jgi:glycosyltransferase involved in cell wall biosynthesis
LNSLRAQTYANWEAIVVNDGSTDDTPLIMEWHAARDRRFRLFHKDNGGVASALNEALRHARGQWICWLSSDDMFEPNRLATIAGAVEDLPDIRFFHTHYSILDERTQRKGAGPGNLSALIPPAELQVLKFFEINYVNGISAAVHREVFEQVGGFNEEFGAGQDFEMWLRVSALYRSHFLPCRTCVTRLHPDQGTDIAPGQILYDSPGIYDSARACLAFLNEHQFAELFPMLDFSDAQHARFAVESTLKVVAYPRSFINRCGFAPALMGRLYEWLTNSATAEIRSMIKPGLVRVTGQIQASNLPEEIKVAFPQPCGLLDKPFLYRCHDPVSEMARHTQRLEDSGETQRASGMKQYLAQFPTAPGEQITVTSQPLFSVLVPCYNQANYLPAALDSLINQTYEHWEAIVVDDGSTDETSDVMARYAAKDKRIHTVRRENGGVASALNEGLRNANGQWICWLSCDDLFEPDKLRIHLQAIEENPNIRFFHTHYSVLYEEMGHTAPAELDLDTFIPSIQLQVLKFFELNYVNGISVAISRDVFEQVGSFNGQYEAGQDFDLWLRISSLYRSHFIDKRTCITRVHPTQGTDVIAGTTVYDSRGVYDSARACLEFLNNHEFPALFPALDLSIPDQAALAVKSTVMVVVDPRSFINRCGFAPALMDRLYEWLTKSAPEQIKTLLKPVLAQMTDRAQSSNLPEEIKIALRQSPGLLEKPFQYRGYDPTAEMIRHVARLEESQREERASAMKQYIARFSTSPCTQVSVVDRPSFSIVVPCYNQAEFLTEALDSILNQSCGDWQAVVVDDGSTDETARVMARYAQKDPRICTIHKENGGVASALNEGIRNAKGDWICWLSSDDFFEPDKLKVHAKYIKDNPDIRFFHTNYMIFNEKMGEKRVLLEDPREHVSPADLQVLKYFERNCANGISVAIHRDVFDDVGHFDRNYRYGQDFDMWLRINARYRAMFIDHKTVVSRWHNDRGTSEFPQAGFYDSCRACVEFMNAHRFTEYFPVIDLTSPDAAKRAATQTMLVAANLNAMMYKCYFNTLLLERLAHWLCQCCPEDLRQVLIPNLQAAVSKVTSGQVSGELRTALFQFSENIISDFRFRPHDFAQEAAQYAQKLAAAGQSERARSIEQYLSMIDSHKPDARQAAAETISPKESIAVPPPDLRSEPRLHRKIESDHADSFDKPQGPLVSVVMPAYNAAAYIAKAIRSVLNQSRRNLELIVVDDGSTDGTKDIVANFNDDRIKYFYQDNAGASSARNLAINKAQGPYIVILDADDMMTPDFVGRHLDEFERNPQADLVYCDDSLIDEDDKPIRVITRPDYADTKLLIRDLFHCGYPVVPFRTCIRSSVFEKIGLYDESLLVGEDYDMVRRFVKCGLKAHHLKEALYLRRMKSDSLTAIHTVQKAKCHFDVVKRFADTFRHDELFPDVGWEKIPAEMRPLHAKCLMAVDWVAIGRTYIEVNSPIYARTAFDLACSQLNDCVKIAPYDPRIRQLLQQCKSVRTGFEQALQQGVG